MSGLPGQPWLSPQFCFSSGTLRDFLRLSRSAVDDNISQCLNGLITPARTGFDPNSTAVRTVPANPRRPSPQACQSFQNQVLFPAWKARSDVLDYCALVAASPDPDDPEATLRDVEVRKSRERTIDERLDPYSARFFPREPRTQVLAALVGQERSVENIVRHRTWSVLQERCWVPQSTWQEAMASRGRADGEISARIESVRGS
ncbi:hypothetical protein E4U43_002867 [Claviceps pusilla]|uniref:Caffeine-induced death protein 2 n=1 Tax=Claviceps pusilla TaxID=123648 RepID=A0A9P7N7P8_9HYPO|nr:hypothetical protein E4U43_002867 [Claviceps pusilla]